MRFNRNATRIDDSFGVLRLRLFQSGVINISKLLLAREEKCKDRGVFHKHKQLQSVQTGKTNLCSIIINRKVRTSFDFDTSIYDFNLIGRNLPQFFSSASNGQSIIKGVVKIFAASFILPCIIIL